MTQKFLLIGLFFGGVLLFWLLNQRKGGKYDLRTRFDRHIPFVKSFVLAYLGLFPFIAFAGFILFNTSIALEYFTSMAFAMYSAALIWKLFPAKMYRPPVQRKGVLERLVYEVYRDDPHANAFPSSHVFTSFLTAHYLAVVYPLHAWLAWSIGIAIAFSTVLIKQHHAVDILGGTVWAVLAVAVAKALLYL